MKEQKGDKNSQMTDGNSMELVGPHTPSPPPYLTSQDARDTPNTTSSPILSLLSANAQMPEQHLPSVSARLETQRDSARSQFPKFPSKMARQWGHNQRSEHKFTPETLLLSVFQLERQEAKKDSLITDTLETNGLALSINWKLLKQTSELGRFQHWLTANCRDKKRKTIFIDMFTGLCLYTCTQMHRHVDFYEIYK